MPLYFLYKQTISEKSGHFFMTINIYYMMVIMICNIPTFPTFQQQL